MNTMNDKSRRAFIKVASLSGIAALASQAFPSNAEANYLSESDDKNLVFLFQGDSITDGNRGRNNDPNHIMGHGYAFSIASRVGAEFPEKGLKFYNRGISGNKITDLESRWKQDTLDLKPDVLSILVGINDASSVIDQKNTITVEQYEKVFRNLLTVTKKDNPDILLVLCEPFILPVGRVKEQWEAWSADVKKKQTVVKHLAKEFDAVFVGLHEVFDNASERATPDYWIWDGIHPTVAGHELITKEWLKEVSKRLTFLK